MDSQLKGYIVDLILQVELLWTNWWSILKLFYFLEYELGVRGRRFRLNAPTTFASIGIDGNFLALIIISGLFSSGMLFTHADLRRNATTAEWHGERAVLSQAIPIFQCLRMGLHENGGILGRKHNLCGVVKELGLPPGFKGRKTLRERWDED
ncbi:hypothetical protein PIIN_10444 [Serendipita indica DSM 11827]|uniref:Uncharacterized protein n=1 Tax=Serendipita indica (strain DSM 11827) TaxID=1109443 RepID=G4TYQ8_SERID|nr:hypothetical protein PIIN_10444 [Serendipita indica DSM 11827]